MLSPPPPPHLRLLGETAQVLLGASKEETFSCPSQRLPLGPAPAPEEEGWCWSAPSAAPGGAASLQLPASPTPRAPTPIVPRQHPTPWSDFTSPGGFGSFSALSLPLPRAAGEAAFCPLGDGTARTQVCPLWGHVHLPQTRAACGQFGFTQRTRWSHVHTEARARLPVTTCTPPPPYKPLEPDSQRNAA